MLSSHLSDAAAVSSRLPNSTTSPKSSPELCSTKITDISSSSIKDDDDYDNDDISVTGSDRDITSVTGDAAEQPSEQLKGESGAFTSIIQKSKNPNLRFRRVRRIWAPAIR